MMNNAERKETSDKQTYFRKFDRFRKDDRYSPIMTVSIQLGVGVTTVRIIAHELA